MTIKFPFHADTIENWIRFASTYKNIHNGAAIIPRICEQIPNQIMDIHTLEITPILEKEKLEIAHFVCAARRRGAH